MNRSVVSIPRSVYYCFQLPIWSRLLLSYLLKIRYATSKNKIKIKVSNTVWNLRIDDCDEEIFWRALVKLQGMDFLSYDTQIGGEYVVVELYEDTIKKYFPDCLVTKDCLLERQMVVSSMNEEKEIVTGNTVNNRSMYIDVE